MCWEHERPEISITAHTETMNHPPIWPGISRRNAGRPKRQETEDRNKGKGEEGGGLGSWETVERERKWETELNRKGVEEGEVDKEITEQGAGQRDIKGFELREKQKEACPIESQSFVNKWDDGRCAGLTWCVGPSYLTMEFTWGVFY